MSDQMQTDVDDVLRAVLTGVAAGDPASIVDSPPGAGKTYLVELAAYTAINAGDRVAVACQTNQQLLDVVARISSAYPDMPVGLLARKGLDVPAKLVGRSNVVIAEKVTDLPDLSCATTAKWAVTAKRSFVDLLVVDEAYQATDAAFAAIAATADRYLLVGDPGQIAPVVVSDVRPFLSDLGGPHTPAPDALRARRPNDVVVHRLPASRRLGPDTVSVVQPVFYPNLPFGSTRPNLRIEALDGAPSWLREATGKGQEIVSLELPALPLAPRADLDVAELIAATVRQMLAAAQVVTDHGARAIAAEDVIVACPHVRQVAAVQAALGAELSEVRVDTVERHQGAESVVSVNWHPLSGTPAPSEFARNAGRMTVAMSRARGLCVLVGRAGTGDAIRAAGAGQSRLYSTDDPAYRSWAVQRRLADALEAGGRIYDA